MAFTGSTATLLNIFFCPPFGYLYFLPFQLLNEPELATGIDPGMALTQFPSSIGQDLNLRPSNHEQSTLITRPDFSPYGSATLTIQLIFTQL